MKWTGKSEFYTFKGFRSIEQVPLTESMEDYLEIIYRITSEQGFARVKDIAQLIHVNPSSASKMVNKLEGEGLVSSVKYGIIQLTPEGEQTGAYLVWRHRIIDTFLRLINNSDNELRQTEQIEHFIDEQTVLNLEKVTDFLKNETWDKK